MGRLRRPRPDDLQVCFKQPLFGIHLCVGTVDDGINILVGVAIIGFDAVTYAEDIPAVFGAVDFFNGGRDSRPDSFA